MTSPTGDLTIAVVPAHNEAASLPAVLSDLAATTPSIDVVVVDDGSTDSTAAVARDHGVPCIRLPFNLGIGGALRAGYRYAYEMGYDRAVQFDGDGQHQADQIAQLLDQLDDGADLVIGNRFANGDYKTGRSRRLAMRMLRFGVRALCRRRFVDTTSGFRAVRRPLLGIFATDYPVEYMDSVETLVAVCRTGYRVEEVPVVMNQRQAGVPSIGRVRLVYHYARLLVVLLGSSRRSIPSLEPDAPLT